MWERKKKASGVSVHPRVIVRKVYRRRVGDKIFISSREHMFINEKQGIAFDHVEISAISNIEKYNIRGCATLLF